MQAKCSNENHEKLDYREATYLRICWGHFDNSLCECLRIYAIKGDPKSGGNFG
ncbi:MAG: hypothetical protein QOH31_4585, partial [Verrucomicrobiota bacterium]